MGLVLGVAGSVAHDDPPFDRPTWVTAVVFGLVSGGAEWIRTRRSRRE